MEKSFKDRLGVEWLPEVTGDTLRRVEAATGADPFSAMAGGKGGMGLLLRLAFESVADQARGLKIGFEDWCKRLDGAAAGAAFRVTSALYSDFSRALGSAMRPGDSATLAPQPPQGNPSAGDTSTNSPQSGA